MIFTTRLLSLAVATASLAAAAHAHAEALVEEVVVVGKPIKQSETAAILAKRDALNVTDSISADTIGRFPDQNLADSLARIPGVAIERDQGQARYVNLRGAPFAIPPSPSTASTFLVQKTGAFPASTAFQR